MPNSSTESKSTVVSASWNPGQISFVLLRVTAQSVLGKLDVIVELRKTASSNRSLANITKDKERLRKSVIQA